MIALSIVISRPCRPNPVSPLMYDVSLCPVTSTHSFLHISLDAAIKFLLLVDPVVLSQLVLKHLVLAKPQINLFLRTLDSVGAVADVAANVLCFNQPHSCVLLCSKN